MRYDKWLYVIDVDTNLLFIQEYDTVEYYGGDLMDPSDAILDQICSAHKMSPLSRRLMYVILY